MLEGLEIIDGKLYSECKFSVIIGISREFVDNEEKRKNINTSDIKFFHIFDYDIEIKPHLDLFDEMKKNSSNISVNDLQRWVWEIFLQILREPDYLIPVIINIIDNKKSKSKEDITPEVIVSIIRKLNDDEMRKGCLLA